MTVASESTADPRPGLPVIREPDSQQAAQATIGSSAWCLELGDMEFPAPFVHELNGLASLSDGRNIFFEAEFQIAVQDRIVPSGTRQLRFWERIGDEAALRMYVPLSQQRVGFPAKGSWRVASHSFGPLSLPLVEFSDRAEIFEKFAGLAGRLDAFSGLPIVFEDIPVADPLVASMRESLHDCGLSTILRKSHSRAVLNSEIGGSRGFVKHKLSRKKRRELGRQKRRLQEMGDLQTHITNDFDNVRLRFEEFLLLETRGWKGRRGSSLHTLRQTAAFARQTVMALALQKRTTICSLRLDGKPLASLIMFRSGNRYYPWKISFDEHYSAYSPGMQLMLDVTCHLLDRPGFVFADSISHKDSWINQLWPDRIDLGTLIIATSANNEARLRRLDRAISRRTSIRNFARRRLGR